MLPRFLSPILMLGCASAIVVLAAAHRGAAAEPEQGPTTSPAPLLGLPDGVIPHGQGVNIHFTDPKAGEMEMLVGGGFGLVRMDFHWEATERQIGVYDFAAFDRLLAQLEAHGLRALFILDYANKLYDQGQSPHSDQSRAAFAQWAVAAATHFRGRGVLWEMWNEPNIGFWKPTPNVDDYAKLALAVGRALRGNPQTRTELYIGPAVSGVDFKFLEACFRAGCLPYWDAVSLHPYRQDAPLIGWARAANQAAVTFNHAGDPETVLADYALLRALIDRYAPPGKTIPIISGEWGYSSNAASRGGWRAYSPQRQAVMLPRQWLVNLSVNVNTSIWYDWHDDGADPADPECHFGLVAFPYHQDRQPVYDPKPAYQAAQTFTRTLAGCKIGQVVWRGEKGDYFLRLVKPGVTIAAIWTTGPSHHVQLGLPAGAYRVVSHLGEGKPWHVGNDGGELPITDAVQYIVPQ